MMTTNHKATAKTLVTGASITNVSSTNTFAGPPPDASDVPAIAQWFLDAPGLAPRDHIDGGAECDYQDGVQCIVRGERDNYSELDDRARELRAALQLPSAARDLGYTYVRARGSITDLSPDKEGRPRKSFNLIFRIRE